MIALDTRALVAAVIAEVRRDPSLAAELRAALGEAPPAGLITIAEYARQRSISPSTVRAAIRDGRLPAVHIGRAVRLRADAEFSTPVRRSGTSAADAHTAALAVLIGGRR